MQCRIALRFNWALKNALAYFLSGARVLLFCPALAAAAVLSNAGRHFDGRRRKPSASPPCFEIKDQHSETNGRKTAFECRITKRVRLRQHFDSHGERSVRTPRIRKGTWISTRTGAWEKFNSDLQRACEVSSWARKVPSNNDTRIPMLPINIRNVRRPHWFM